MDDAVEDACLAFGCMTKTFTAADVDTRVHDAHQAHQARRAARRSSAHKCERLG